MTRRLLMWALVLASAGAVWVLVREDTPPPRSDTPRVAVRASHAVIVLRRRGVRQARIVAERVEVSANQRFTIFTGRPRAVFYNGDAAAVEATAGRIVLDRAGRTVRVEGGLTLTTPRGERLRAARASWDQESEVIELLGQVTGTSASPGASGSGARRAGAGARQGAGQAPGPGAPQGEVQSGFGRLRADRIRYDARSQTTVASGNVQLQTAEMTLRADTLRLDSRAQVGTAEGKVTVRQRDTTLAAPALRYEFSTSQAEAWGGVVLERPDATVRAPQMRFDLPGEVTTATGGAEVIQADGTLTAASVRYEARSGDVTAEGGVRLTRPGLRLSGRTLLANLPGRRARVEGDAVLVRAPGPPPSPSDRVVTALARQETTVTASRLFFRWDVNEGEAEEQVVVKQRDKTAWADHMSYSEPANRMILTGHVILDQLSGEWLVREGLVQQPREPRDQEALASRTRLTCTRLTMTLRERDIVAEGPLTVTQKGRSASGDRGTYTEATKVLVLTGNARMRDADGQRLRADSVVISLIDETFEAEGDVETEFVIRSQPSGAPRPASSPAPTSRPSPTPPR